MTNKTAIWYVAIHHNNAPTHSAQPVQEFLVEHHIP
jgi:hypothetical protein